jgi:ribonucleoside-triphosphate reductase
MLIIKRNGTKEEFNPEKIEGAILKAFKACNYSIGEVDRRNITEFIDNLGNGALATMDNPVKEEIPVECIQDKVEKFLCKRWFPVGKAYMLYREQHKKARLIKAKLQYIHKYTDSNDSATNLSNTDDNANTNEKNAATLEGELYKDLSRTIQRSQMKELLAEIKSPYRDQYVKDLEHHIIYQHDESCPVLKPYCSAYTLYPLLVDGTTNVDGTKNHAPHHLSSFCGQFQNLVFLLSAQKKGAGAYGEFFNFFSYFCEKEWGLNYWQKPDLVVTNEYNQEQKTIGMIIDQHFQSVTHYLNQPAGNRGYQCPFTNFNVFDSYYWHTMFDDFYFPDGTQPHWDAVNWLQKRYIKWLNEERTKTLLTFPVMTVCCLTDENDVLDKEYKDFITTQWAEGDSFFVYLSKNADSISSCCRLRNEVTGNTFSSTTGLTGVQTGSCNVMTLNLNRIVQDWVRDWRNTGIPDINDDINKESLQVYLENILDRVYDYQKAYKTGLYNMDKQGMFPQTRAGYINFDKLYCTIGVNGLNEAARFLGLTVSNNEAYMSFASWVLNTIKQYNKKHSEKKFKFNLELVPAESLGVKNYNWDKEDGYWVPDDENLYNSYIYDAHDDTSVLDKIAMQGGEIAKSIDGGQASHINLEDNLSKEQYTKLLEYVVQVGNSYITFNVPQTQCDDCGFIAKHPFKKCPKCGSEKVTLWTRIIGYLRPIKAWSKARQLEGLKREFTEKNKVC